MKLFSWQVICCSLVLLLYFDNLVLAEDELTENEDTNSNTTLRPDEGQGKDEDYMDGSYQDEDDDFYYDIDDGFDLYKLTYSGPGKLQIFYLNLHRCMWYTAFLLRRSKAIFVESGFCF